MGRKTSPRKGRKTPEGQDLERRRQGGPQTDDLVGTVDKAFDLRGWRQ
jgi:hypothetical protein